MTMCVGLSRRQSKRVDERIRKKTRAERAEYRRKAYRIYTQSCCGTYGTNMIDTSVFYGN